MTETETKKAHKKGKVLVDVVVTADLSGMIWCSYCKTQEDKAKELERATNEFHGFLRDHRSQDLVTLDVQRIYKDLCSACGNEWEPYIEEDGKRYCAYCGAETEETAKESGG